MNKAIYWLVVLHALFVFCGCTPENELSTTDELISYFNGRGRWPRFQNSTLMYGEKLTEEAGNLLRFDSSSIPKIYRKAAHVFAADSTIVYFMYGLASSDSILSEWRVRSFRNNEMIADVLLLKHLEDDQIYRDYWFNENLMVVYARNSEQLTHYSLFRFENGQVINETRIPDTVFDVHVIWPDLGRRVQLSDGYYNNEEHENKKEVIAKGRILKFFGGGKSCPNYMIIKLDAPYKGFQFVHTHCSINTHTSIYGLVNDSLELRPIECFEPSYWPVEEPLLLEEDIYIEYQR